MKTRTPAQIRSHAQKYFSKVSKHSVHLIPGSLNSVASQKRKFTHQANQDRINLRTPHHHNSFCWSQAKKGPPDLIAELGLVNTEIALLDKIAGQVKNLTPNMTSLHQNNQTMAASLALDLKSSPRYEAQQKERTQNQARPITKNLQDDELTAICMLSSLTSK